MLKKLISYTDFNDEPQTDTHFFHLSQAELVTLEAEHENEGGIQGWLTHVSESGDGKLIVATFKDLVLRSYGERSPDGKRFIKNARLREEFESSEAYSVLFIELATNADAAAEFVRGIMPANLQETMKEIEERQGGDIEERSSGLVISRQEASEMDDATLRQRLMAGATISPDS